MEFCGCILNFAVTQLQVRFSDGLGNYWPFFFDFRLVFINSGVECSKTFVVWWWCVEGESQYGKKSVRNFYSIVLFYLLCN